MIDRDELTMTWFADMEKTTMALTPQQIVEALRRQVNVSAISIVKAGDFKRAAAAQ